MKKILSIALAALLSLPMAQAVIKVHTIGDSTMEQYNESATDKRGWATYLGAFFDNTQVVINNRGKSGKDTRTYYNDDSYWKSVKNQMSAGDYLIIQFAHNDEGTFTNGTDNLEYRAYCEATGTPLPDSDTRGTNPQTTYRDFLRLFIDEARAKGVNPILVGPICRAYIQGNSIKRAGLHDLGDKFSKIENGVLYTNQSLPAGDSTMSYVKAMKVVAAEKNVPFIDLTAATRDLYLSYGSQCLDLMFVNKSATEKDATHTNAMGANLIAREAAILLKNAGILANYITIPTDISANPTSISFGETYSGVEQNSEFLLTGYGLDPASGSVSLTAEGDLTISTNKATFAKTATVNYTDGTILQKVYVRVSYASAGDKNDKIVATFGNKRLEVPVTATVISLEGGSAVSATWAVSDKNNPGNAVVEGPISAGFALSNMCAADTKSDAGSEGNMTVVRFHNGNTKTAWPANEIDEVATRYIDFAVTAPATMEVRVTGITMEIGAYSTATMKCHINTGFSDNFEQEQIIYEASAVALPNLAPTIDKTTNEITAYGAPMTALDLKPMLTIPAGETLHLRILPWHESTKEGNGKYICLKNVKIEGQAFEPSEEGIENAEEAVKAVKFFENGQLFIEKNGVIYNAQGAIVK